MRRAFLPSMMAGLLAAGGLMACSEETSTVLQPLQNRSFNFILNRDGANVPRGSVTATRSAANVFSGLTLDLQGLEVLRDPYYYQVWLAEVNNTAGTMSNYRPLSATSITFTTTDTSISPAGDFVPNVVTQTITNQPTTQFNRGGPGTLIRVVADAAARATITPSSSATSSTVVLITIDSNPASPTVPDEFGTQGRLWARGINAFPAPANPQVAQTLVTPIRFGNFHASTAQEYIFLVTGRGRGALLEGENILILDDSSLARPPRGYFYAAQLFTREDDETFYNLDTISLGPITAPFPDRDVSLFNADVEQVHPVVQTALPNPQIFAAQTRVDGDTVAALTGAGNPFRGVAMVLVTLESKFGTDATSPVIILWAAAPPGIRVRD